MTTPMEVKERLIELATMLLDHCSPNFNNLERDQDPFMLDPLELPFDPSGGNIHFCPGLPVALLNNTLDICIADQIVQELSHFGTRFTRDPRLLKDVVVLLDREIQQPKLARERWSKKIGIIAKLRRETHIGNSSLTAAPMPARCDHSFSCVLINFDTHYTSYRNQTHLHYEFDIAYATLMSSLQNWTSARVLPPPRPIINDPQGVPIQLAEYSLNVMNRLPGKSGYTVEDGPWYYRIFEVKKGDKHTEKGTGEWQKLETAAGFDLMMSTLRNKRQSTMTSCAVYIIHSQDWIAQENWNLYDREMKCLCPKDEEDWFDARET